MKITYLGTGAAEGVPAIFCNCAYCLEARKRGGAEIRSRAQTLYDDISVDFSADAFYHSALLGADLSAIRYLLVTHSHMDHFCATDFVLRGHIYAHNMTSPRLEIYGNEEVCKIYEEMTRREMISEIGDNIGLHPVGAFEEFTCGDWKVYTLAAHHSSVDPLVYLLEKDGKRVLHLCDTGPLPDDDYEYLAKIGGGSVQLVTLDCTLLYAPHTPNGRHMGIDDCGRVVERLREIGFIDGQTKCIITHFSHNSTPTPEAIRRAEREYGFIAAYDGMELTI